ncbi:hypothetical protein ABZV34_00785 [Streptomyces sp. NPDC005195]
MTFPHIARPTLERPADDRPAHEVPAADSEPAYGASGSDVPM